jgi:CRISPR-associated endonuclease/helicase Cas3/CRISPR-associated endonuclease Cas3-HD
VTSNTRSPQRLSHRAYDGTPIPLTEHLDDVTERVEWILQDRTETLGGRSIVELGVTCAAIHDVGKLTTWFQEHLDGGNPDGPTDHALLGAFGAYYALEQRGFGGQDPLVGFIAVARHHGAIPDAVDYVYERTTDENVDMRGVDIDSVEQQIANIDEHTPLLAASVFENATDGAGSWDGFEDAFSTSLISDICSQVAGRYGLTRRSESLQRTFYDVVLQVWSGLCLADKTGAASITGEVDITRSDYQATPPQRAQLHAHIDAIRERAEQSKMNKLRDEARAEVLENATDFVERDEQIATITLPTGLGKTLAGLDAALSIRDAAGGDGRIVYALPFTSIIDQVAAECRRAFETNGRDATMTVHHYLAETETSIDARDQPIETDARASLEVMLGESWRSGLIVTTFVQLLESLAGPKNTQSMKLPSLYGAVVILDEPQTLPESWWALARRLAELLTEQYDATVIAMTATQPRIFTPDDIEDPFPLVDSPGHFFREMDRVTFHFDTSALTYGDAEPNPLTYEKAGNSICDAVADGSTLAICNTIDSAIALSQSVTDRLPNAVSANEVYTRVLGSHDGLTTSVQSDEVTDHIREEHSAGQPVTMHLTTRHRPVDRRLLLDVAERLLEADVPLVLVSTQLVEAGVDVSFDRVYRDFAPLDSIVQAAGRCNRSNAGKKGRVTLWLLEPPTGTTTLPSSAVYGASGNSLPKLTAEAISGLVDETGGESTINLPERTLTWDGVRRYYSLVAERNPGNQEWVEQVNRCEAEQLSFASLIEQRQAYDVTVVRTDREAEIVESIERAYESGAFDRVDDRIEQLKETVVSVPVYAEDSDQAARLRELYPVYPGATQRYIKGRPVGDSWFSPTWGLSVPEDSLERRFL